MTSRVFVPIDPVEPRTVMVRMSEAAYGNVITESMSGWILNSESRFGEDL